MTDDTKALQDRIRELETERVGLWRDCEERNVELDRRATLIKAAEAKVAELEADRQHDAKILAMNARLGEQRTRRMRDAEAKVAELEAQAKLLNDAADFYAKACTIDNDERLKAEAKVAELEAINELYGEPDPLTQLQRVAHNLELQASEAPPKEPEDEQDPRLVFGKVGEQEAKPPPCPAGCDNGWVVRRFPDGGKQRLHYCPNGCKGTGDAGS